MTEFLFWLFTLMTVLLIPGCMIGFGRHFRDHPPGEINSSFGYRSARSMRNRETWDFAHAYSGRFWYRAGRPMLAVTLVWMHGGAVWHPIDRLAAGSSSGGHSRHGTGAET